MRIVRTVVMAAATLGFAVSAVAVVAAQERSQTGKAKASKRTSKAAPVAPSGNRDAEAAIDKARRALDEGKADVAQQFADSVLTSANKDARSTARALAVRGEAYLGQGRPAEALADLESALWVKDGLQGSERSSATMARGKAMEQAGLAKASPVIAAPLPLPAPPIAPPQPAAAPRPVAAAPPQPVREAPRQLAVARSVLAEPDAPRSQPAAAAVAQPSGWNQATTVAPASSKVEARAATVIPSTAAESFPQSTRTATAAASRDEAPDKSGSSGGGLTGFLSGLFGGGSESQGGEAPATTAAVGSTPARATRPATSSFEPQRVEPAARRQPTEAAVASPRPAPVRTAAIAAPATRPQPPTEAAPAGAYRLQLAAVRTKAEAEEMVAKVREEEPAVLGKRNFEIVEDVYGNMGRFYRVRIGAFMEPTEALSICATLRDKRMDCMVLDR